MAAGTGYGMGAMDGTVEPAGPGNANITMATISVKGIGARAPFTPGTSIRRV